MRPYATAIWLALVCLILGPFAPWAAHLGALRRRGLAAPGGWLVLSVAFVFVYAAFWLAPLRLEWIAILYLLSGVLSFAGLARIGAVRHLIPESVVNPGKWRESLALGFLVVLPMLFAYALLRDINNLREFSIYLPAAVYIEALTFTAGFGIPGAVLLAFLTRLAGLRPKVRLVLYLYGGTIVMAAWISVWERCHQLALFLAGTHNAETLLFEVYREISYRSAIHWIFYGGGILLGVGHLALASNPRMFLRRAIFLALPTALGYSHFVLFLGEGGYLLAGLRGHYYAEERYGAYRAVAEIETARLPHALHVPSLMSDLAGLAELQGRGEEAHQWRHRVLETTGDKPYFALLRERVKWEEDQSALHPSCVVKDSMRLLPVPRSRSGVTLDGNWYGLLSAVSFLRPQWNDFDIKKKLLEVSPDIQLSVPLLGSLPSVTEVLDVFEIPFSPCFLDSLRLHDALNRKKIPFLNFEGRWIPVVGWDPCRRGFLCYRFPDSLQRNPWFNSADKEAVFGGRRADSAGGTGRIPYNVIAFVPERDLLRHLHDIGGVALVLGDSAFAPSAERRAAYLTEYGDALYQEHDDNEGAAKAYARAQELHPSDYILARMASLERRAVWSEGPEYGLDAVFRNGIRNQPLPTGMNGIDRERMKSRIVRGEMGPYLLLNWHQASPWFFAGKDSLQRDSARAIFRTWLALNPYNPAALDSMAAGFGAQGQWDSARTYYRRALEYYPLGNEFLAHQLAWVLFKQDRLEEMDDWLARSRSFEGDARHLLMRGAADWRKGRSRAALAELRKSLKIDKSLPETHALLERLAMAQGDSTAAGLSRRWRERTTP